MNAVSKWLPLRLLGLALALAALSAPASPALGAETNVGGTLTLDWEAGLNSTHKIEELDTMLQLKVDQSFSPVGAATAVIECSETGGPVTLREGYVDLYLGSTDLRLGKQRIAWGTADGVNPTDNLNPIDYRKPFEDDNRLPAPALQVKHYLQNWRLEAVWLPVFVPSPLPATGDRWAPPLVPPAADPPARTLSNSEVGVRVATSVAGVDASVSYFSGWDDLPAVHFTPLPVSRYHRLQAIGADWAAVRGKFTLRGEAAYFRTEDRDRVDPEIKNPYLQYVVGLDYAPSEKWYVNAQFVGEQVEASAAGPSEPGEGAATGMTLKAQYKPDPNTEFAVEGMYNFTDGDSLIKPSVSRSLADGVNLSAGLVYLAGEADTRFGQFDGNDYAFMKLAVAF